MEIVGWILLSLLALVALLLVCPLRLKLEYIHSFSLKVYLFGCLRVYSFHATAPQEETPQEAKTEQPEPPAQAAKPKRSKPSLKEELNALRKREGIGGVIALFKRMLSVATGAMRRVALFVTVRRLSLCVRVGGQEADKIAKTCGTVSAALFPTLAALSEVIRFRKKQVLVQPDFLSEATDVRMRMIVWVWPFGVLWAALVALCRFIGVWMSVTNVSADTTKRMQTKTESE